MSITKKPKRPTSDIQNPVNESVRTEAVKREETKAEAFIAGASEASVKMAKAERQPVLIRFDPDLLRKVEEAAGRRGISRSAWIQYVLSVALEKGEG